MNGLSQWYRADKNALNTGNNTDVTSWTEFFQGIVATQKGTNALPKFRIGAVDYFNFNPGINFTVGTQTIGNNAVRTLTSLDYDVFTLTKEGMVAGGGNPRYFSIAQDNSNTSNDAIMDAFGLAPTGTVERRPIGAGTQYPGINPAFATAIPSIMYHKLTNTTAAKGLNGGALGATATYNPQGEQFGGHFFGDTQFSGNGSDNRGFVGNIGETIVYGARTLTDAERRKVDTYLAIKYGLTLGRVATDNYISSADAAIWNGALNTTYNNNVFGLAKDDISELHQKVSVSVSAGPVLIMATNNDFVSQNADASRTSLTGDQKYFLAGDNAVTTTSLVNITAGANPGRRIQKVWLSQRTNTLGNIYFAADLAAYGTGFASTGAVRMFVADDAAFTVNVQSVTGTFSSGKWVFNKSFDSDASARYFTFGIEILPPPHAPGGVFTGIAKWYRADRDATLVTGRVSTLLDQVSDTETITQPTATRRPLYNSTTNLINFNPNMVFTPNPHIGLNSLTGGYAAGTEGITSFSVAVPTTATLGQRKYIFGITNVSQSGDAAVDNAKRIAVGNVDCGNSAIPNIGKFRNCDRYVNTGAWTAGIPSIIKAGSRPAPNNISFFISQNGNTTATATGSIAMNYSEAGFGLGSRGDNEVDVNVYGWNGQISEVILYGGELSETDQRRVDSYLAIKHGITLARVATNNYLGSTASSSSVIWDGALNTTYNKNVFGIARADIGDFHQKVSKSINAGTILTIAKDNDFVSSNLSASRTGLTSNESYLLVGDNTVTATPLVSFTVAGTNAQRIQRIWLSQRTSTTGNIYLEADLSAYGTTFAAGNNIRMFVADNAAFTVNVQSVQGSFSGGKWVFSKSFDTDATARYITFGSEPQPQVLWLKADKGVNTFTGVPTADNTQLTTWFDQLIVDGGQNGVQATIHPSTPAETNLPTMPYYRYNATDNFNFNPVVNFDAAGNGQSVQMLTPTKASQTIISVFKSPGITGQNSFYGSGLLYGGDALNSNPTDGDAVPKSDLSFAVRSQSRLIAGGGSSGDFTFSGNVLLNNLPSIGTLRRDRISDENVSLSMYSNGTVKVSPQNVDPTNGATGEGRDLINAVRIGKTFTAYENGVGSPIGKLNGAVAETIVYERVLTDAERARVETYLAVKYGITLTGGTQQSGVTDGNVNYPYVNSSGAVVRASDTTYLYDVFGLGRDDFYGLNQRISKSNNPGDILTVSTNTDFTSLNLDATRTEINGDKEFMLFANNRGGLNPVTQQTTELPANVQRRLDREWKVAQANTDGTNIPSVSLKFNMAGVTLTGATGLNLMLLVDSDGDGNFTTGTVQQIPASFFTAGTEALFNNVALANGQVFTLGIDQDVCYKPGAVASAGNPVLPTKAGVTALGRAGSGDADNWPMVRNGGWLALESKTKGFVLNKVAFTDADSNPSTPDVPVGIAPANFIEGMMVYDTTNSCLKIYTSINNGTSYEWRCMNTQTCPD